jgi:hypothetical protein
MTLAAIPIVNLFSVALFVVVWLMLGSLMWMAWKVIKRLENPKDDDVDVPQGL